MKWNLQSVIASICKKSGIRNIWVLDADNMGFFPLKDSSLSKLIKTHNPQAMCLAAASEGMKNHSPGVCVFPSPSTLLEAMDRLYAINERRIPLLAICFTDENDQVTSETFRPILRSCDFYLEEINDPHRIYRGVANALQHTMGEKSVSILLLDRALIAPGIKYERYDQFREHDSIPVIVPENQEMIELASLLDEKKKITIICGSGCRNALTEINVLSAKLKSVVAYVPALRSSIEEELNYPVGIYGKWSQESAQHAMLSADLILLLDFSEKNFCEFPNTSSIIQISPKFWTGVDKEKSKRVYRGDVADTLELLIPLVTEKKSSDFADALVREYREGLKRIEQALSENQMLHRLVKALNNSLDPHACLCAEGKFAYLFQNCLLKGDPLQYIHPVHDPICAGDLFYELMGLSSSGRLIQAIGLIDADRLKKNIRCLYPMTLEQYSLKMIVFNKDKIGEGMQSELEHYAENMRIDYKRIDSAAGLEKILDQALFSDQSCLIEVTGVSLEQDYLRESYPEADYDLPRELITPALTFLQSLGVGKLFYTGKYQSDSLKDSEETEMEFSSPDLQLISPQNLFYAALGGFQVTRKLSVCLVTSLSQLLQMMPGINEALRKRVPVLLLVVMTRKMCHHSLRRQTVTAQKLIHVFSCHHRDVGTETELSMILGEAFSEAMHQRGISTVLFQRVFQEVKDYKCSEIYDSPYTSCDIYPSEREIENIAKEINRASSIVVFAGNGARNAHKEVIELVRKVKAPLGWSFKVKDVFDYDNYFPIGMNGLLMNDALEEAYKKCDLLILLGTNLSFENKLSKTCRVIQIDLNPANLGNPHPVDIGVVGEVKKTLQLLLPHLLTISNYQFAERCRDSYLSLREKYEADIRKHEEKTSEIIIESVFMHLNKIAPEHCWVISDMVLPWYMTALNIKSKGSRRIFGFGETIYNSNSTGFALGAAPLPNHQPLIVFCTDITFLKQMNNLFDIAFCKSIIKLFILHLWPGNRSVDYSDLIPSQHIRAFHITEYDQLLQTLHEVMESDRSCVVDIRVQKSPLIKTPPMISSLAEKYGVVFKKLYVNSEKEHMLDTFGRYEGEEEKDGFIDNSGGK